MTFFYFYFYHNIMIFKKLKTNENYKINTKDYFNNFNITFEKLTIELNMIQELTSCKELLLDYKSNNF